MKLFVASPRTLQGCISAHALQTFAVGVPYLSSFSSVPEDRDFCELFAGCASASAALVQALQIAVHPWCSEVK